MTSDLTETSTLHSPLRLTKFATVRATLGPAQILKNGPAGTRIIASTATFEVEGPRLRAGMAGQPSGDWALLRADGTLCADVRVTLRTHDDAIVLVEYSGICDLSGGWDAAGAMFTMPRFETASADYAWLNSLAVVGKGSIDIRTGLVSYDWYEVA